MTYLNRFLCLVACIVYSGSCMARNSDTRENTIAQVNINPKQSYQTIEGWGSSLCWWAGQVGNWNEARVDSIVDIITSPDKLNMNIFRYNIGGGDVGGQHHHVGDFRIAELDSNIVAGDENFRDIVPL